MSSDADRSVRLEALLNEAWREHRGEVLARVSALEEALALVRSGKLDGDARAQANSTAHKLAGVLGTFGLREASRAALEIEFLLAGTAVVPEEKVKSFEVHLGVIGEGLAKRDRQAEVNSE